MASRRKKRVRLGAGHEYHSRTATAFALRALRALEAARSAPSCRVAPAKYGEAEKHLGALAEHIASAGDTAPHTKSALAQATHEADDVQRMIAGRCLR